MSAEERYELDRELFGDPEPSANGQSSARGMTRGEALALGEEWVRRGVPVFPIAIAWDPAKGGTHKRPLTEHGHHDATLDERTVRLAFNKATLKAGEEFGVGLCLGTSGCFAVDLDGLAALEAWDRRDLPATYTSTTCSGGRHVIYRKPEPAHVGTGCEWGEVDVIRSDDGWIVAPGTVTSWGEWVSHDDWPGDVIVAPTELWSAIDRKGSGGTRTGGTDTRGVDAVVAKLEAADRGQDADALRMLCERYGAHHPWITRSGEVFVTRPDKTAGTSASVGYVGPGIVKMFSRRWEPFTEGRRYLVDGDKLVDTDSGEITKTEQANVDAGTSEIIEGAEQVEVLDPSRFFDKSGLLHASLRTAVRDLGPIATGPGRSVWHYRHGVWLPSGDDEVRRRCRRFLGQRWRKSHAEGVVSDLAADEPFITDAQPTRWINCRNGLLDWATGTLHPHDPHVPSTYQLAVDWDPDATCPTIDAWLIQVAPDDAIDLVWEVVGTAVYPDQPFHRAVLLLGPGRNGKGTLLRLVSRLIGRQHISAVTLQALGENRFVAAELFGKVANIAGDLDSRAIGRTDVFKMATGGDLISAEHKYGAAFQFYNRATMLFSANEPPGSVDHTDGFFGRWVVLPFNRLQLRPSDEDHGLEPRLHVELDGALVRAVTGLRRAMERGGYDQPRSVTDATLGYREVADPLRRFVEDCLHVTDDHADTTPRSAVYTRYREWCEENGQRPLGANRFWGRLVAVAPKVDPTRISAGVRLVGAVRLIGTWR